MKCLRRNKSKFYFANYEGDSPLLDEYGNETGEYKKSYSAPVEAKMNISPTRGETETMQFGDALLYDRVIVMDFPAPEINEQSILWIDRTPENGAPHDYIVKRVAKSLNSVSVAVSKVDVSE